MFSFVSIFLLTSTQVLTEKCPLPFCFHHQRYQQVVDEPTQKAVQHPGRAITTTVTYKLLSKAMTKHATIFDDIVRYNLYYHT